MRIKFDGAIMISTQSVSGTLNAFIGTDINYPYLWRPDGGGNFSAFFVCAAPSGTIYGTNGSGGSRPINTAMPVVVEMQSDVSTSDLIFMGARLEASTISV